MPSAKTFLAFNLNVMISATHCSTSQIYNIASNAFTLGWKQITIVDALTHEQLTGKVRPGRSTDISIIYVQIDSATEDGAEANSVKDTTVLAKRINIVTAPSKLRERILVSWGPTDKNKPEIRSPQAYYEKGMLLYDHFKPVYNKAFSPSSTTDDVSHARAQVLSLDPPLPVELTDKITAYTEEEFDMGTITMAPAKWSFSHKEVEIHLLVPMDPHEIAELQATYDEQLLLHKNLSKNTHCVVHPWIASQSATRADLWRLFKRMCDTTDEWCNILVFAGWPGWKKGHEVGIVRWNREEPPATRRLSIATAAMIWHRVNGLKKNSNSYLHKNPYKYIDPYKHRDPYECRNFEDHEFEFLLDPDAPFCHNPSQFVSLEENVVMVPAFWLTQHITDDDMAAIREELHGGDRYNSRSEGWNPRLEYTFVPWTSERDGTEEDMWRLLWQRKQHSGFRLEDISRAAMFIDHQTLSRGSVIIANIL
ncbi:MAG: hypothetical protein Q9228_005434 [Teloschistes exilis]